MVTDIEARIDWQHWYERWERQQAAYTPGWEDRFTAMLDALGREPAATELIAERERRFARRERPQQPIYDVHVAALRDAGFREVGSIWQRIDNRVLMAVLSTTADGPRDGVMRPPDRVVVSLAPRSILRDRFRLP